MKTYLIKLTFACLLTSFSLPTHSMPPKSYSYESKSVSPALTYNSSTISSAVLKNTSVVDTKDQKGLNLYIVPNDAMNLSNQCGTTTHAISDARYRYKAIELDEPGSTKLLDDQEMQTVHQQYLEGSKESIKEIEKKRNELDEKLHSSRQKSRDYLGSARATNLRRLEFMDIVLWHYCAQQETKSESGPCLAVDSYFSSTGRMVTLDREMQQFKKLAKQGELDQLESAEKELEIGVKEWTFGRYQLARRVSFLRKVKHNPIALAFHRMLTAPLEDAGKELATMWRIVNDPNNMSGDIRSRPASTNTTHQTTSKFTQEHFAAAEKIYHSRADYKQMVKRQHELEQRALEKAQLKPTTSEPAILSPYAQAVTEDFDRLFLQKSDIALSEELHKRIAVDPKIDFKSFLQQTNELLDDLEEQGVFTGKSFLFFIKGTAEVTGGRLAYMKDHPAECASEFAKGYIEMAKDVSLLLFDVYSSPEGLDFNEQEMALYETRIRERVENITRTYNYIRETIPQMSRKDWERLSGRLLADYFVIRSVDLGINKILSIKLPAELSENPLFGKIQQELESFGTQYELVTAEGGLTIKLPKNAEGEALLLKRATDEVRGTTKVVAKDVVKQTTRITAKQANVVAEQLGFRKTNYYSNGQPVFQKGNRFISIDVDAHNGGIWKMANSVKNLARRETRMGTYDQFLKKIGD